VTGHWFPFLIEVKGETGGVFGVQFIDTAMHPLSLEVFSEEVKWLEWNSRQVGGNLGLMLFLVGDEPADTRLSPEVKRYLEEHSTVRTHRTVYRPRDTFPLTEIDDAEQGIEYWPGDDGEPSWTWPLGSE
jgi:hypothetical protein